MLLGKNMCCQVYIKCFMDLEMIIPSRGVLNELLLISKLLLWFIMLDVQ